MNKNRYTKNWKRNYPKRKETIERVYADCKEKHGLRFTRIRGLKKNQQELLNAKLNKKKNKENSQNKRKSLIKVNE